MTAKKRFLRKQKKWKAWGAAIAAEEILMDQEASILFPTMCDKLQKAMAIRPEYDITKEFSSVCCCFFIFADNILMYSGLPVP